MKHRRFLPAVILVPIFLMTAFFTGCGNNEVTEATGEYEIVGKAVLGESWQMYQLRVELEPKSTFDIAMLELSGTDRVDGYFYTEKGPGANVEIKAGVNVIYTSHPGAAADGGKLSDRFSFTANQPAGTSYVLKFQNSGEDTVNMFVELIYPKTGVIRGPIDLK